MDPTNAARRGIKELMADPPSKGYAVLIGDAAHATSLNMASGAAAPAMAGPPAHALIEQKDACVGL